MQVTLNATLRGRDRQRRNAVNHNVSTFPFQTNGLLLLIDDGIDEHFVELEILGILHNCGSKNLLCVHEFVHRDENASLELSGERSSEYVRRHVLCFAREVDRLRIVLCQFINLKGLSLR